MRRICSRMASAPLCSRFANESVTATDAETRAAAVAASSATDSSAAPAPPRCFLPGNSSRTRRSSIRSPKTSRAYFSKLSVLARMPRSRMTRESSRGSIPSNASKLVDARSRTSPSTFCFWATFPEIWMKFLVLHSVKPHIKTENVYCRPVRSCDVVKESIPMRMTARAKPVTSSKIKL